MSEPKAVAKQIDEVAPGVWHWEVLDERIDFRSDAHAVASEEGVVLIDPLPLEPAVLQGLGPVAAICLTAACHERSAWRYRQELGVEVYAPAKSRAMDDEPDHRYTADDLLPGGLRTIRTPGPEAAHYAFLREDAPAVLFCPDLVMRLPDGSLTFIPGEYHEDPAATRASVRRLLKLDFAVLCFDHGAPLTSGPHAALRALLAAAS